MADASITSLEAPTNSDWPGSKITVSEPATSGETVSVCLKHPGGIIIERYEEKEVREQGPTGYRLVKQYFAIPGSQHTINGYGKLYHFNAEMRGMFQPSFPGNHAITHGVPKSTWDNWLHHHKNDAIVQSGMIFAVPSPADAPLECRSRQNTVTGFEPLDSDNPAEQVNGREGDTFRNPVGSVGKVHTGSRD